MVRRHTRRSKKRKRYVVRRHSRRKRRKRR